MQATLRKGDDLVGNAALPALHGGVVGAFLELTALVPAIELTDSDRVPKPINFSIDYLRSVGTRETRGRAEIVKHGRRIANVRVLAWQDDPPGRWRQEPAIFSCEREAATRRPGSAPPCGGGPRRARRAAGPGPPGHQAQHQREPLSAVAGLC